MANFSSPAHTAAMGNAGGMMILAAGAVGLASAIGDGMRAAREESEMDRYINALERAVIHGQEMERVARLATDTVANLRREVAALTAACRQRQEVIEHLMGRA